MLPRRRNGHPGILATIFFFLPAQAEHVHSQKGKPIRRTASWWCLPPAQGKIKHGGLKFGSFKATFSGIGHGFCCACDEIFILFLFCRFSQQPCLKGVKNYAYITYTSSGVPQVGIQKGGIAGKGFPMVQHPAGIIWGVGALAESPGVLRDGSKWYFLRVGIPQDDLMEGSTCGKPGGAAWWEQMVFPMITTPRGPPGSSGILPNHLGVPLPKRDGPWEWKEYYPWPGEGRGGYYSLKLHLFYSYQEKLRRNSTITIRTPGVLVWTVGFSDQVSSLCLKLPQLRHIFPIMGRI